MNPIATPVDLWRVLCTSAGLELRLKRARGRDEDIEETLRKVLRVPAGAGTLETWLAADAASRQPCVSLEDFLVAVLKSQVGFAEMMMDILELLVLADARRGEAELCVEFKFDSVSDPIKATLEQFRTMVLQTTRVLESRPVLPDATLMWQISERIRVYSTVPLTASSPKFPAAAPISLTGHAILDRQLAVIVDLVKQFRKFWQQHGADRRLVGQAALALGGSNRDEQNDELRKQLSAATDYWDVGVIAGAEQIARRVINKELDAELESANLASVLGEIQWGSSWMQRTVEQLLDILSLPTWRKRHELYSVWVGTQMLRVIAQHGQDVHFHTVDGTLSFAFGGSRLASYDRGGNHYIAWAELRSALVGTSRKRKRGIQPDFRVVRSQLAGSADDCTTYVLECKHYLQAKGPNFTDAAADYARSCPEAFVHVVNHGPADDQVLGAALETAARARVGFIGNATPGAERRYQLLGRAIVGLLFPGALPTPGHSTLIAQAPNAVAYALILWDASLEDIDLALQVLGPDGTEATSIDYREPGSLNSFPFALCSRDVRTGPGEERIDVGAWHFRRYRLVATNFSRSGRMGPHSLRCEIATPSGLTRLSCPADLGTTPHEWRIAEIAVEGGVPTVLPLRR